MKKFLKLLICALTLVVGCGVALANPTINIVNAVTEISVNNSKGTFSFTVKNMVSKVNAKEDTEKDKFFIPFPETTDGASNVTINVKVGSNTYKYVVNETEDNDLFKKKTVDGVDGVVFNYSTNVKHEIYFTAKKDDVVYSSSIYNVIVSGVTYSFDVNLDNAIPKIAGVGDKILIPTLKVLDANGKDQGVTIIPTVKKGSNETADLKEDNGSYYLTPSNYGTYTVTYKSATHRLETNAEISVSTAFNSEKAKLEVATLSMSGVELGRKVTLPKPEVTDTYNNLSSDYVQTNVKISIFDNNNNLIKTLKENSYDVIFNKAGSYIVKYEISNLYLNNKTTINTQLSEELVVSDTTDATVLFAGDYTTGTTTEKATVIDLAETQEETTTWEDEINILKDSAIPTRVGYNEMVFPAIYASDLGVSYDNMTFERTIVSANKVYNIDSATDNAELESDNTKYNETIQFTFARLAEETNDAEGNAKYSNRIARTYTLVYKVTDKTTGKEIGRKEVEFSVLPLDADTDNENTSLSISLPTNIPDEIESDQTISVNMNSSSYGALIKDDKDTRIETNYFYYYGEAGLIDDAFNAVVDNYATGYNEFLENFKSENELEVYELEHTDNKFEIALGDEYNGEDKFTVVAVAINDQGHFACSSKEIAVIDTTADSDAPEIVVNGSFNYEYNLGVDTRIDLPEVEFTDVQDKELTVSAKYYVDSIENGITSINGGSIISNETSTIIRDAYITPERAGTYYVVYTATDRANNSYDFITSFEVKEQNSYAIKLQYSSSVDIYDSVDIIANVVDSDGNVVDDYNVYISFNGIMPEGKGSTYTFDKIGEYNFVATTDAPGATEVRGTITVNEISYVWDDEKNISVPTTSPISPVLEYQVLTTEPADWATEYASYYTYNEDTKGYDANTNTVFESNKYYLKNEKVYVEFYVPQAYLNGHKDDLGTESATVTVTDPNSDSIEVIPVEINGVDQGKVKFEAKKEGKYTVVFKIGTLKKTFYVQVGDNEKPVVQVTDKTKVQKDVVLKDDELTYQITYVLNEDKSNSEQNVYNVTFKIGDKTSYQTELVLYDVDRNGNKVAIDWASAIKNSSITLNKKSSESSSEYIWTISEVGEYELKIIATDTKGIESIAETIKFKVTDESDAKTKKDNKVGIILIVLAVIVLAGIACYFAFSGKNTVVKSKKVKEVKEDEDDVKTDKE